MGRVPYKSAKEGVGALSRDYSTVKFKTWYHVSKQNMKNSAYLLLVNNIPFCGKILWCAAGQVGRCF